MLASMRRAVSVMPLKSLTFAREELIFSLLRSSSLRHNQDRQGVSEEGKYLRHYFNADILSVACRLDRVHDHFALSVGFLVRVKQPLSLVLTRSSNQH